VKSLTNVKLCKDLSVSDLSKRFVGQGKQMLVFLCKTIKLMIVYTKSRLLLGLATKSIEKAKRELLGTINPL
jgi:hypothetical protein